MILTEPDDRQIIVDVTDAYTRKREHDIVTMVNGGEVMVKESVEEIHARQSEFLAVTVKCPGKMYIRKSTVREFNASIDGKLTVLVTDREIFVLESVRRGWMNA